MPQIPLSRRDFLITSAAFIGTAALSGIARADEAPAKKLGFAFVGLGGFAVGQLLPKIPNCRFCKPVALVSGHPDKAKTVAAQYGIAEKNIYNYDNFDSIKNNPEIDVVYIVLPNGMHAEYTVRAFQAGKHVMCEKPMANTVAECKQMIDAGKSAGKKMQIGYRQHFDSPTLACIAAIRHGDIGAVQLLNCETGFVIGDPSQWRLNRKLAGGGCMMDIGIYSLNAARYLSGEEPTEVFAHTYQDTSDPHFKEVEQHCDFQLKFPSGALASGLSSYNTGLNRFSVHGHAGTAVLEPGQSYHGSKFQITKDGKLTPVDIEPADQFIAEMDGFSQAITGDALNRATGEEGMQDLRIIEAMYESAKSGKAVKL